MEDGRRSFQVRSITFIKRKVNNGHTNECLRRVVPAPKPLMQSKSYNKEEQLDRCPRGYSFGCSPSPTQIYYPLRNQDFKSETFEEVGTVSLQR